MKSVSWPCVVAILSVIIIACNEGKGDAADPAASALKLLDIHGLLGRRSGDRPADVKNSPVDRAALDSLIKDLDVDDPFTTDIYVGFVVGALARNQDRLFVSRQGKKAQVGAGKVTVQMELVGQEWKINLAKTVPEEFKAQAALEKKRYDDAKVRAGSQ